MVKLIKTTIGVNIFKTFLLYFLVFILPITMFFVSAYFKTLETLTKHDEERSLSRLSFIGDEIEEDFINLLNVFNRIGSTKWVSNLFYESRQNLYSISEGSDLEKALNELKNFPLINNEVLLTGIYFISGDFIIDNYNHISEATDYFKNYLILEGISVNNWYKYTTFRSDFSLISNKASVINGIKHDGLTFLKTIPANAEKPRAILFAVISINALNKIFSQYSFNNEQICLIDKDMGILFNSGIQDINLFGQEVKNVSKVTGSNRLFYKDLSVLPWSVIYSVPINAYYGKTGFEKNIFILYILIISLGLLAVYSISVYINKPVMLASSSISDKNDILRNDLKIIKGRIDFLDQKQKTLDKIENSLRPPLFELNLFHLINGHEFDFSEVNLKEAFEDIYFKDRMTFVISVNVNSSGKQRREILGEILKLSIKSTMFVHLYIKDMHGNDVFLIKVQANNEFPYSVPDTDTDGVKLTTNFSDSSSIIKNSHDIILRKIGLFVQKISRKHKTHIYIGTGSVCTCIEDIYASYLSSIENLKYNILTDRPENTGFIDFSTANNLYYITFKNEEEIIKNIELGETSLLENNLNNIIGIPGFRSLDSKVMRSGVYEFIYSQLISIIIRFADKSGKYNIINCPRFFCLQSINDAIEYIKEVCKEERICLEKNALASDSKEVRQSILDFVNDNYLDGNMSLKLINEKFGVSFPLITKIVKDASGTGFNGYIGRKRISYAKKLLKDPKFKVCEISKLSGYYDEGTFIRVFKKIVGVTPGCYRDNL